jgi:pimeloyl-ACP methyl ester carboxylesterase
MAIKLVPKLALLLLLLLVGCGKDRGEATLPLEGCYLEGGFEALCGTLQVPEARGPGPLAGDEQNGRRLDLRIAVFPATGANPAPDPLFMFAGGPGQAAVEVFPAVIGALENLNRQRDIVLIDQRGTGESAPLACPELEDEDLESTITDEELRDLLHACAANLAGEVNLSQYTTENAVQDFEEVRQALGYDRINLYGGSYGTRAALAYARSFPERVRTMTLDAVAGPELVLFLQMPRDGQRALDMLFGRCAEDPDCRESFPDVRDQLEGLIAGLQEPEILTLTDPLSGEPIDLLVDRERLTNYVFNILYSAEHASLLPLLIKQAYESGDLRPLASQALISGGGGVEPMLLYAVTCAEDAPLVTTAEAEAYAEGSLFSPRAKAFLSICEGFPDSGRQARLTGELREPLTASIPTLLLSGEADPITPPGYADTVAASLPNSLHLIAPGYGHGTLFAGCTPRIFTSFVSSGTLDKLDISCRDALQPPPFFVDFAGPEP